jgi:hypothetical protein
VPRLSRLLLALPLAVLATAPGYVLPGGHASAAPTTATPTTAAPDPTRTFGVQTATGNAPDRRGRYTYSATPGASLTDRIAIRNYGNQPLTLRVYASDAFNTPDGGFDLLAAGRRSVDTGAWVKPGVSQVTVPAKGMAIVPFRLAIPANATPGDHVGGIVASLRTVRTTAGGKKVAFEDRVGARVYLRVSGQLRGELRVEDVRARYDGPLNPFGHGRVRVTYTIHNTGNLRLSGHQTIRVAGWFGQAALATGLPEVPELLPGSTLKVDTVVPHVFPAVHLKVTAEVDPRPGPGDVDPRLTPAIATASLLSFPWSLALTIAGIALAGALATVFRRRPRGPRPEQSTVDSPKPHPGTEKARPRAGLARRAALLLAVPLALPFLAAAPASAAPAGKLAFTPAKGDAGSAITLTTSARCPSGTNILVRIYGAGFPRDGQVAVANTPISALSAGVTGYQVPFAMSVRDLLNLQPSPRAAGGAYKVVLTCRLAFKPASLGDFTGTLTFGAAGRFTAPAPPKGAATGPGGVPAGGKADPGVAPGGGRSAGPTPNPGQQSVASNAADVHSRTFGDSGTDFVTLGLLLVALVAAFFGGTAFLRKRRAGGAGRRA